MTNGHDPADTWIRNALAQQFLQGSANHFFKLLVTTGHRGAGTRSVQGATDFLREIALEDITFFDVVVTINQHATFIARGNFFGIFLEPFQLGSSDGPSR